MSERTFVLDQIDPQLLYGVNNQNLNYIKQHFPKLQFVARGDTLKVMGDESEIENFTARFEQLGGYFRRKAEINEAVFSEVFGKLPAKKGGSEIDSDAGSEKDVLLYGTRSQPIRPRTPNQKALVHAVEKDDVVFALGPAGSGKTFTAVAIAVRALKNREIRRIILTRPAVEAGENLGFLPGDLKEKIDPYLRPLYDALEEMIPMEKLKAMIETRIIEVAPMAFMRGRTLDNCYVILDEAQNSTEMQLKMFLTRMGPNAKVIVTGDMSQIDLPRKQESGLSRSVQLLRGIDGISVIELKVEDVVRHRLVKEIIRAYGMD